VLWSLMYRTIFWELVRVFLMSLFGITGMLLMAGLIAEATQHGLTPSQLIAAIPLLIPSTLPYTLPATTLFATCVVYGRLAHDNEILAIKAAGINIVSVVWPSLFLGLAMSIATTALYYNIIPTTHFWMRSLVLKDIEEFLYTMLKREKVIRHQKLDFTMAVHEVRGRKLIDAVFTRKDPTTHKPDLTARAEEATMKVDLPNKKLTINMDRCVITSPSGAGDGYYRQRAWIVDLPPEFGNADKKVRTGDMTWCELMDAYDELSRAQEKLDAHIAVVGSMRQYSDPKGQEANPALVEFRDQSRRKQAEQRGLLTEILMRPALGVGCLCFVIIGCPIGIWFSKSDYLSAFITCFLPIVTFYYPLLLCGSNMAKSGKIPAAPAIWCADVAMLLAAVPLYHKLLKN
jgi:lipopolysaccharide export system permease protein